MSSIGFVVKETKLHKGPNSNLSKVSNAGVMGQIGKEYNSEIWARHIREDSVNNTEPKNLLDLLK